ncbi:hypothetical protein PS2_037956 [Malus domestica]
MQPNNSVLGHLEDISIFQRMGLKRNAGERSSKRTSRLTKRAKGQAASRGRARKCGHTGYVSGHSETNEAYEENLLEVPVSEENLWPYLEDIVDEEETMRSQRLRSNQSGSGGWPDTAAS